MTISAIEAQPPVGRDALAATRKTSRARTTRRTAVILFLLAFDVYHINFRGMYTSDAIPNMLVPLSILTEGTISLDPFLEYFGLPDGYMLQAIQFTPGMELDLYYLRARDGHVYSAYPIALPLVVLPVYAPVVWALGAGTWEWRPLVVLSIVLGTLAASIIAAASVVVMFVLLRRLTTRKWATILALAYAVGTSTWTTSGEALWQQGASTLFLLLTLLALSGPQPSWWRGGLWAALALAVRPTNVFLWAIVLGVMLLERRRAGAFVAFALPGAVTGLLLVIYNWTLFGDVRGGYDTEPLRLFSPTALAGLLASPSRGLLIYSPVVLFAALGAWLALRRSRGDARRVYAIAALYALASILFLAHLERWWGGASWGPRLLTETTAALVVLMAPATAWIRTRPARRALFAAAFAWSLAVQAIGAFCYPMGLWEATPVPLEWFPRRAWDWHDTQLGRAIVHCRAP
ncbi:MAG: hypothetical protein ACREMQ_24190 [Longimicrobiales bacterium]